jgi:hypothetical protein
MDIIGMLALSSSDQYPSFKKLVCTVNGHVLVVSK